MLFFAGCLGLGIAFLSAVGHLLAAVDLAVALRARELLAGDVQIVSSRTFNTDERAAFLQGSHQYREFRRIPATRLVMHR